MLRIVEYTDFFGMPSLSDQTLWRKQLDYIQVQPIICLSPPNLLKHTGWLSFLAFLALQLLCELLKPLLK